MTEYYRQFAFVSSVLAGFAFAFYGDVAPGPDAASNVELGSVSLASTASIAFLLVTLGTTFCRLALCTTGGGYISAL